MMKKQTPKEAHYEVVKSLGRGHFVLYNQSTGLYELFFANKGHASWGLRYKNTELEFVRDYGRLFDELMTIESHLDKIFSDRVDASVEESLTEYKYIRCPETNKVIEMTRENGCMQGGRIITWELTLEGVKRDIELMKDTDGYFNTADISKSELLKSLDNDNLISLFVFSLNQYSGEY